MGGKELPPARSHRTCLDAGMHSLVPAGFEKVGRKSDYAKSLLGDIHSDEKTLLSRWINGYYHDRQRR